MKQQSLFTTPKRRSRKRTSTTKTDPLWSCVFGGVTEAEWQAYLVTLGPSLDHQQAVSQAPPAFRRECV